MGNQSTTGKKLLVTKRNMRSGSGALSTWGTNLTDDWRFFCYYVWAKTLFYYE